VEVWRHFNLVQDIVLHAAYSREALQWLPIGITRARRVKGDEIAASELPQHRGPSMVGLGKASLDPNFNMIA
jgi:hypothetical protein